MKIIIFIIFLILLVLTKEGIIITGDNIHPEISQAGLKSREAIHHIHLGESK